MSPNTAAFLNMMGSSMSGSAMIPNILNAITGVLASSTAVANGTNSPQPHPLSDSYLPPSSYEQPKNYSNRTSTQSSDSRYFNATNNTVNTPANGLFLLSQAHQELTKGLRNAQRANWTVMMIPPLQMPPASEARSASLATYLHRTSSPQTGSSQACAGVAQQQSQSVATRFRLKRKRKNPRDLLKTTSQFNVSKVLTKLTAPNPFPPTRKQRQPPLGLFPLGLPILLQSNPSLRLPHSPNLLLAVN